MVTDPRHRQISKHLFVLVQIIELDAVTCGDDDVIVRQHHAFGITRGARGIEDDRDVVAPTPIYLVHVKPGVVGIELTPQFLDVHKIVQAVLCIVAKPTRVVINNELQFRTTLHDLE